MKRIVYPPSHGTTKPRCNTKRLCRECHTPATYAEIEVRPAAQLNRAGCLTRLTEHVTTYWCGDHTGITR